MKDLNLLDYFPISKPRQSQLDALKQISESFNSSKKYTIARLPTGSGKSHIGVSVARAARPIDDSLAELINSYKIYKTDRNGNYVHEKDFLDNASFGAFILTVSRSLQDQYKNLFEFINLIKGQNNYQCKVDPNATVDIAPCLYATAIKKQCFEEDSCPYYRARRVALLSNDSVLNYKSFFSLPFFLKRRQFFICDEAREINAELVSGYTLTINYSHLQSEDISFKKIITDDSTDARTWLTDVFLQLKERQSELKQKVLIMSKKYISSDGFYFKSLQKLSKINNLIKNLGEVLLQWEECEYIVEQKDSKSITFVPCDVRPLAQNIFKYADKVLLMSATISNHKEYAKSLGISPQEYQFIDIPSSFQPEKSPIYISSRFNLSHKSIKKDLPRVIETIEQLCDIHKKEKGIIHTHTNFITEAIKDKLSSNDRFLFRETGISNEDIIKIHKQETSKSTILVSPSLGTGLSLDGELGKFQIIVKAPFLPLDSKRIKKIFNKNPDFYIMEMLDSLVQMCGRCTRSQEDSSVTYILDGSALKVILRHKNQLPKDFLDRFK